MSAAASQARAPHPAVPAAIWRRRALVMGVVGLLVAIPITLLAHSGGHGGRAVKTAGPRVQLNPRVVDSRLEVSYRVPRGWHDSERAGLIELRSGDAATAVSIGAPAGAPAYARVLSDALSAIRDRYSNVRVSARSSGRLGGLPARTVALTATSPSGMPLAIAVTGARGKARAYLIEVFTNTRGAPASLVQAQALLNSLRPSG